jgi:hypothetical protein
MQNTIYIITLTIDDNESLIETIISAKEMAGDNKFINFKHLIISPKDHTKIKENGLICKDENYSITYLKDSNEGIYHAFNLGIESINEDGYVIFLAAGDRFKKGFIFSTEDLSGGNAIIAYAVEIQKKDRHFI